MCQKSEKVKRFHEDSIQHLFLVISLPYKACYISVCCIGMIKNAMHIDIERNI